MKLNDLRQFEQFSQLSDEQLIMLNASMKSKRCQKAGEIILPLGFQSDIEFFLLQGSISLTAEDGQKQIIKADSQEARLSIARLRPCLYEVRSESAAQLLVISGALLTNEVRASIEALNESNHFSKPAEHFHKCLKSALEQGKFTLPSLPSVALKVREVLEQDEPELEDLERILNKDPSMTAKLVAAANSSFYRRNTSCKTCAEAIMRLGLDTTSQLVMLFSLRQLFKAKHPWVKQRMTQTWSQSVSVAAIAQLLTLHHSHLSGDQALLLGLVHNLGELAILLFIDQETEVDPEEMEKILEELMPEAGAMLLNYWNFDPELTESVRQQNNWQADSSSDTATLADLVKVARLHSRIGTEDQYRFPRLDEVPAFRKLAVQGLTPEFSLILVEDAADQLAETRAMFGL
ncbi:MAG: HDOD domain-containing protein [Marinospirillum sp.]|uniref:HDOD domain-containing protein n=1 Tax=Marinospirillum sp. TaxID=2183934 RepID=UPI0019EA743C|nr:HDOD domain-containing protein [Marinospirillum sp.]MBE0507660.1 HDOD domain-containing protein [Marinospirillum sp.]